MFRIHNSSAGFVMRRSPAFTTRFRSPASCSVGFAIRVYNFRRLPFFLYEANHTGDYKSPVTSEVAGTKYLFRWICNPAAIIFVDYRSFFMKLIIRGIANPP